MKKLVLFVTFAAAMAATFAALPAFASLSQLNQIPTADIMRVAKDLLRTEGLNLAIIGPHLHKEQLLTLLRV